jgi:hypothetical protein
MTTRIVGSSSIDRTVDGRLWLIPGGWTLSPRTSPTHCRSCQAPVLFAKNDATGKSAPFDYVPDIHEPTVSVSHFATCPHAAAWRKP